MAGYLPLTATSQSGVKYGDTVSECRTGLANRWQATRAYLRNGGLSLPFQRCHCSDEQHSATGEQATICVWLRPPGEATT